MIAAAHTEPKTLQSVLQLLLWTVCSITGHFQVGTEKTIAHSLTEKWNQLPKYFPRFFHHREHQRNP